jgi:hypothetical protein
MGRVSDLGQGGQKDARHRDGRRQDRIRDMGKKKTPARYFLRAQFFDYQGMSQGGQVCQTIF